MAQTNIYSPANEFGKPLIPVGTPRDKSSITTNETIDPSWLDTVNTYSSGLSDSNSKVVLYPALKAAVEYVLSHSAGQLKFKVCDNGESDLPQQITEQTIAELKTTIYLIRLQDGKDKNQYSEYVCKDTEDYSEETKDPVPAEYEELGSLNYALQQANETTLGGVKLFDGPDASKTAADGYAATPKSIYDLKQQIQEKSSSFTINTKTISDGDSVTISSSSPIQVNTEGDEDVTITLSISDANDSQKGVIKLFSSSEPASSAEDGALNAKITLEEIKKVEAQITGLQIPKIVSEDKSIVEGKVTIDQSDIFILSAFINDEQFLPQVQKTESSYILTFFENGDPYYNNGTQATINYISR